MKLSNYLISSDGEINKIYDSEAEWIIWCLQSEWDTNSIETLSSGESIDWDKFISLCHRERVSPLIYALTRDRELLPGFVQERFQNNYHENLVRNTYLSHELGIILNQIMENISVLLLKGAALIESGYENPAVRPMADLDLLILPQYINQARLALDGAGYESYAQEPWPEYNQRYRLVAEYSKRDGGRYPYFIDLHWGILDIPYYRLIPIEDMFSRAEKVDDSINLPCPEDHFLVLCGHLGLHERYDAPLIRYYDLAILIQQGGESFSWEEILERAAEWKLVIPMKRALLRLQSLWPEIIPESITQNLSEMVPASGEQRIHSLVVDRQRNPTSDVLFYFATMPGFFKKTRFLLEQAFPSPAYMRQLYCPNRPSLWPLTYFLRAWLVFQFLSQARIKSRSNAAA